jgi:hypothetical protein
MPSVVVNPEVAQPIPITKNSAGDIYNADKNNEEMNARSLKIIHIGGLIALGSVEDDSSITIIS